MSQESSFAGESEGKGGNLVNGMSNGYKNEHKSHNDDRHRDKDRHHSDRERQKHSSSKSSHRDKDHDKDRDKDRKHREDKKSSHEHKSSNRDKDHKSSSSSSKDKGHKSSSSSNRDKHHSSSSSKDKEKDRHSVSHKDKDKHNSSSSKDKEKHSSSSSKDKHHHGSSSSRDKEKDKHGSKDKDRHKERDKSKSHSEHHREKSKESRDKEREREKKREKEREKKDLDEVAIKHEDEVVFKHEDEYQMKQKMEIKEEEEEQDNEGTGDSAPEESLEIDEGEEDEVAVVQAKQEESEDEMPLALRAPKRELEEDDEDDTPLFNRVKKEKKSKGKKRKSRASESEDEEDYKPTRKPTKAAKKEVKSENVSPRKGKKEEEQEVWRWWEEDKKDDGTKWKFLEHKGPLFAPPYERLPRSVKFLYDGKEMELSEETEEVATFYAKMLDHEYTSKTVFNTNFFNDWRKVMTDKEKHKITELKKCNFKPMALYFKEKTEERKAMSKEEKKKIKEQNEEIQKEYGFCLIDGHKEKIGNFRIEPPGLFRGRGEHPKMGMLKKRVLPREVIINCSKDAKVPTPPAGHHWKKVQHEPTVTWLASWTENVQNNVKYVMLNPSSKLKGEKDMLKYEMARKLAKKIHRIRDQYQSDWKSKEMRIRQRAVALYFIDRLALRAGNEKDEDQADTVGCCSLRVEHVELHKELNGKEHVVVFDFLGKDSIRYYNEVPVEKRVFKNLLLFKENKQGQDDLFDRLNTTVLNKHLNELMEGLTAKVFRTYNASWTLQEQLSKLTNADDTVAEKILSYNRANRAVAILCNHQRSVPKSHEKSMENLKVKKETKKEQIDDVKKEMKDAKRSGDTGNFEKKKKQLERLKEQLLKLEVQETDREENKTIALGTSKLNYLDPRISVAWCKKYDVPIEKIYNKTQRDKFRWAIDMAGPDYVF